MNTVVNTPSGESPVSAVSWAAILVGAATAAALALILISLGAGLGFASVSPWAGRGLSGTSITIGTALWLLLVQIITSGLGGYLTGRLRVRWVGTHTDEVFFRDTAHGLAAWAVAAVVGASLLSGAAGTLLGSATSAVGKTAAAVAGAAGAAGASAVDKMPNDYVSDLLMRSDEKPAGDSKDPAPEIGRILAVGAANGGVSADDKAYLAKLVARQTGIDPAQAQQRVDDVLAKASAATEEAKRQAKEAADAARKGAAMLALWVFISLLAGAFFSSLMAMVGGRLRDKV
jgi:hypothetical protein